MSFELSKTAIRVTAKNNELLFDKFNIPSVMVKVPKMKMCDLIDGGSENVHPAFIVNGVEQDCIYISKFQNTIVEGVPASIPFEEPATGMTYDEAKELCESKGSGWHLMTNAEWSLLTLLSIKNKTEPYGNNNKGSDITSKQEGYVIPGSDKTFTGSGSVEWSSDYSQNGVFDLNGNVNEWVAGLRLYGGQIQVLIDNNAAAGTNTGEQSTLWKTIKRDGSYGEKTETEDTYFYDYQGEPTEDGLIELSDSCKTAQTEESHFGEGRFETLIDTKSEKMRALALSTVESYQDKGDVIRIKNSGERLARRGGSCNDGEKAGICSLDLTATREYNSADTGFRACYIPT